MINNIPEKMRVGLWCVWKKVKKDDRTLKIPYGMKGRPLSTAKPLAWLTFKEAKEFHDLHEGAYAGLGKLVEKGFICIDVDKTDELPEWINKLNTYVEISPSGNGFRAIGFGDIENDFTKPIEIYSGNRPRFVTVTGNIYGELRDVINIEQGVKEFTKGLKASIKLSDAGELPNYSGEVITGLEVTHEDRSEGLYKLSIELLEKGHSMAEIYASYCADDDIFTIAKDHWRNPNKYLWSDINRANDRYQTDQAVNEFADDADDYVAVPIKPVMKKEYKKMLLGEVREELLKTPPRDSYFEDQEDSELQESAWQILKMQITQPFVNKVTCPKIDLDRLKILFMRSGKMGNLFVSMTDEGYANKFNNKEFATFINMRGIYGALIGTAKDIVKFIKNGEFIFMQALVETRQISQVDSHVNYFIEQPTFNRTTSGTLLMGTVWNNKPFPLPKVHDISISQTVSTRVSEHRLEKEITPYKKHFKHLDQMVDLIVSARFASNRKGAYMWLHAPSNWGKGVFISAFQSIDLVIETSEDELEKAMSGAPIGLKLNRDAWILLVDEFKKAKSEIKQLDNNLIASEKNKGEIKLPLYTKMFMSAEVNDNLVGDAGASKQFENRFNYFPKLTGDITDLEGWNNGRLVPVIHYYIINRLNTQMKRYIDYGRKNFTAMTNLADSYIDAFNAEFALTGRRTPESAIDARLIARGDRIDASVEMFASEEDSHEELAEEFKEICINVFNFGCRDNVSKGMSQIENEIAENMLKGEGEFVIKKIAKILKLFLKHSGGIKLRYAHSAVLENMTDLPKQYIHTMKAGVGFELKTIQTKGLYIKA